MYTHDCQKIYELIILMLKIILIILAFHDYMVIINEGNTLIVNGKGHLFISFARISDCHSVRK